LNPTTHSVGLSYGPNHPPGAGEDGGEILLVGGGKEEDQAAKGEGREVVAAVWGWQTSMI
jgi:hypothetical protein